MTSPTWHSLVDLLDYHRDADAELSRRHQLEQWDAILEDQRRALLLAAGGAIVCHEGAD